MDISNDISENDISITLLKKERHHEELQVNIGNQVNQEQNWSWKYNVVKNYLISALLNIYTSQTSWTKQMLYA